MKNFIVFILNALIASATEMYEPHSYGRLGTSKKVLGIYPRTQITDAREFPYRVIGQLEIGCTATLIGPKHIITAGHCVYSLRDEKFETDLQFFPGQTDRYKKPFGQIDWKKIFIPRQYVNFQDKSFDFAVIELAEAIGDKIGWSGFKAMQAVDQNIIRLTGYPGDKSEGTMWTVTCPSVLSERTIQYKCDTFGGMSGSGIFPMGQNLVEPSLTGIHTMGTVEYNSGVVLTESNFELVRAWRDETAFPAESTIIFSRN